MIVSYNFGAAAPVYLVPAIEKFKSGYLSDFAAQNPSGDRVCYNEAEICTLCAVALFHKPPRFLARRTQFANSF